MIIKLLSITGKLIVLQNKISGIFSIATFSVKHKDTYILFNFIELNVVFVFYMKYMTLLKEYNELYLKNLQVNNFIN